MVWAMSAGRTFLVPMATLEPCWDRLDCTVDRAHPSADLTSHPDKDVVVDLTCCFASSYWECIGPCQILACRGLTEHLPCVPQRHAHSGMVISTGHCQYCCRCYAALRDGAHLVSEPHSGQQNDHPAVNQNSMLAVVFAVVFAVAVAAAVAAVAASAVVVAADAVVAVTASAVGVSADVADAVFDVAAAVVSAVVAVGSDVAVVQGEPFGVRDAGGVWDRSFSVPAGGDQEEVH
jgi:hypothetical protein